MASLRHSCLVAIVLLLACGPAAAQRGQTYCNVTDISARQLSNGVQITIQADGEMQWWVDWDDVVAQGVLTLSVADGFVSATLGEGETLLAANYGYDRVRFLDPVYPGDTVSATIEVAECEARDDDWGRLVLDVTVTNQDGDVVLVAENVQLVATEDFEV